MKRLIEVLLTVLFGRPRAPPLAMGESAREKTRRDVRPEALAGVSAGLTWPCQAKPSQRFPELAHRQRRERLSYDPLVLLDDALVDPESRRKPRRAAAVLRQPTRRSGVEDR